MPVSIKVPTVPYASQSITLSGFPYVFTYSYNTRDESLRLSIENNNGAVLSGLKLMSNQSLNLRYSTDQFSHGELVCVKLKETDELPTLGNIGIGLDYELWYYTTDEILEDANE